MPEFIIHIGPHKTGTTYLQTIFQAAAPALRDQGVLYPDDQGQPGHVMVVSKLRDMDRHAELAAEFDTYSQSGCRTVLISAEDLAHLSVPEITVLRDAIGTNPTRIVFYCRSPAAVALSNWGESVRHGHATPLDQALTRHLERPFISPPINYGISLHRYAGVFGRDALNLVSLEALSRYQQDLETHFASTFLGLNDLPSIGVRPNRNASLPLMDAEIIRALNAMRLEREKTRDATMRRLYVARKQPPPLPVTRAAMARQQDIMLFDETTPKMLSLHKRLLDEFGARLVKPSLPGRFFVPLRREIAYIRQDYLDEPGVKDEIEAAYFELGQ